jgi:hypothetical protein
MPVFKQPISDYGCLRLCHLQVRAQRLLFPGVFFRKKKRPFLTHLPKTHLMGAS